MSPAPTADELEAIYRPDAGYFVSASRRLPATDGQKADDVIERLNRAGVERGAILDVGCGTGELVYHLQRKGWRATGVDLNADTVAIAAENRLDARCGTLESQAFAAASFDAVHMGDVIEHVPDLVGTLREINRILRPGGALVLNTPNAGCGFARLSAAVTRRLGLSWPHSEAPYHLNEFTPDSLTETCRRAGFEVVELLVQGGRPFLYTVDAAGCFDGLKRKVKQRGVAKTWPLLLAYAPLIAAVAAGIAPMHVLGAAMDRANGSGSGLWLTAMRS